jgi:hypothetical protein
LRDFLAESAFENSDSDFIQGDFLEAALGFFFAFLPERVFGIDPVLMTN